MTQLLPRHFFGKAISLFPRFRGQALQCVPLHMDSVAVPVSLDGGHGGILGATRLLEFVGVGIGNFDDGIDVVILAAELLQRFALGLGDQQGGENSAEHKQSEDLHDMVQPGRVGAVFFSTTADQGTKHALRNDGADLAGGCADTVRRGTVPSREALSRDDEGSSVGSKVEEELCENVHCQQTVVRVLEGLECKTDDDEQDCQEDKASQLDWLAPDGIDCGYSDPVPRDGTSADQDQVSNGVAVESFVDILSTSPPDRTEDN